MALSESLRKQITDLVVTNRVVLFMKGNRRTPQCGFPRARSLTGGFAAWDTEVGHLALPLPAEKSGE